MYELLIAGSTTRK